MSQSARSRPKALFSKFAGTTNEDEIYQRQWVENGLVGERERLPDGTQGFNISKMMKRVGTRMSGTPALEVVEEGDDYNSVRVGNWAEGWAKYVEKQYGHRNAFAALSVLKAEGDETLGEFAQSDMDDAETVLEKVATKTLGPDADKSPADSSVVQGATPIMIDPDFVNTVRSAAPILEWVDVVAQAGFTASYNVISAREEPAFGWSTEAEVRDMTSSTGAAFTMPNEDKAMKIWADLIDVSDFASRAQSSLDFMDLEGTALEVRSQEWATEEAEMLAYGNPAGALSDGSAHDAQAPEGLYAIADGANTSYTKDKSTLTLSGDKPLFEDIKTEILGLVKNSAAMLPNLGIVTSFDMFNALENEANVNVRLDAFDGSVNFGRDPGPTTLSICNVPILPDPNIRDHAYGSGQYAGNVGDVFIFDRTSYQRRALQALSSTPLGDLGLADRIALFQYETPVDKSQGEFVRVLENYGIDAI